MAGFTLDTAGGVLVQLASSGGPFELHWSDLSPFERGYVEAMMEDANDEFVLPPFAFCPYGFSDLAPETLAAIRKDCAALHFEITACVLGGDVARGRIAWEWRQRVEGDPRSPLRALHDRFLPLTLHLSEDGKVRFAQSEADS